MNDPIDNIEWLDAASLTANDYNPNMVFNAELRLLERSLLSQGWIQPLLITADNRIIDGFHRWRLSLESKPLLAKYAGKVPCARLNVDEGEAMALTVRMNRAKGTHAAFKMAEAAGSGRVFEEFESLAEDYLAWARGMTWEQVAAMAKAVRP